MRCDYYTEHNGKEYRLIIDRLTKRKEKEYRLVSNLLREGFKEETKEMHDAVAELLKQGFHHYSGDTYVKYINKEDIKEVYHIDTYVKYEGHIFYAWMDNDKQIWFVTVDCKLAQELEFEPFLDRGSWIKCVDKDKVEVFEVKKLYEGKIK